MEVNDKRMEFESALRAYEHAHARWMDGSIFEGNAIMLKREKDRAKERYVAAYKAMHPDHIIMG